MGMLVTYCELLLITSYSAVPCLLSKSRQTLQISPLVMTLQPATHAFQCIGSLHEAKVRRFKHSKIDQIRIIKLIWSLASS